MVDNVFFFLRSVCMRVSVLSANPQKAHETAMSLFSLHV